MVFRDKNFYEENKIDLILDKKAETLDTQNKVVALSGRETIPFDKLLIATGGRPIVPEIKGLDCQGVFTFFTRQDAEAIRDYIAAHKVQEAVVLGGGLIGLKATEALIDLKIRVTIVELADRILSATFDKKASNIIEKALKEINCSLIAGNTVTEIGHINGRINEVRLKDARKLKPEMLILAIGTRPNTEVVRHTPIKVAKGIVVDKFMRTNVPDIYAAGDCCEVGDLLNGTRRPIAIWPNAHRQGKAAGFNMAGKSKEYAGGFAMNAAQLCGIPTISMGITAPEEEGYEIMDYLDEEKSIYKKIVLRDSKIVGAVFVGDIERAGIYTGLIREQIDVSDFREYLLQEDFGFISLPKEYRKHMVEGEAIEV
jgi:NAD(P)H-nitrite reductase large subunit